MLFRSRFSGRMCAWAENLPSCAGIWKQAPWRRPQKSRGCALKRSATVSGGVRWFPAGAEQRRSLAVIDEVPRQLQNRNKQFAVSGIGPHARRRDYMGVVERLTDAGTADPRQPRSRADESLFPRYRSFGGSNERARPRILCRRRLRQGLRLTRRC